MNWKSLFFKKTPVIDWKEHSKIDKKLLEEVLEERRKEEAKKPKIKEYIIKHNDPKNYK